MRALVIGRFQPLHNGHLQMLGYVAGREDEIVVGIGSSNRPASFQNPFTFSERRNMIESCFTPGVPVECVGIPDFGDDNRWVGHVLDNIEFDVFYTNSVNEKRIFEEAGVAVEEVPFYGRDRHIARHVREKMVLGGDWQSLVPKCVEKIIAEVGGVERVKSLRERV